MEGTGFCGGWGKGKVEEGRLQKELSFWARKALKNVKAFLEKKSDTEISLEEICKKSNRKTVRTAGTRCEIKGTLEAIQVDTAGKQDKFRV